MIVVAGLVRIKPGTRAAVDALAAEVVGKTHAEAGCITYEMYPVGDDGLFIFEEWESGETLKAHSQQPHTQAFGAAMKAHVAAPISLKRYEVSSAGPL